MYIFLYFALMRNKGLLKLIAILMIFSDFYNLEWFKFDEKLIKGES